MKTPMQNLLNELYDNTSEGWYHVDELREIINKYAEQEAVEIKLAHEAGQDCKTDFPMGEFAEEYFDKRFSKLPKAELIKDGK